MKPTTVRSLILVFLLGATLAGRAEDVRLLFAGSSSTYWNDFPREVATVVDWKFSGHPGAHVVPEI